MADDAGALLVRSGLVTASALDDARSVATEIGGTIGEALVRTGTINDDALTDFYCTRLLVPKVNPNNLARLSAKVIAVLPADMAIELRAIPVSHDAENNLTIAMSDPSDRHAVDEIAFFTSAYVVRAVATQMQIAWCLAHYYGHVTPLGQRLLQPTGAPAPDLRELAIAATIAAGAPGRIPRTKGLTGRVEASRHRAMAPVAGPVVIQRPNSAVLDDPTPIPTPTPTPAPAPVAEPPADGVPVTPRPKTASGEIRVPKPRAQSIKPPIPEDESGPVITMEVDDDTGPIAPPKPARKQRVVREDPPELAARAGEVSLGARHPAIERNDDEPSILIDQQALAPTPPELEEKTGEIDMSRTRRPSEQTAPETTIMVAGDDDEAVLDDADLVDDEPATIHSTIVDEPSAPILLERRRPSDPPLAPKLANTASFADELSGDANDEIVVLKAKPARPVRTEKRTQVGIVPHAAVTARAARDTEAGAVPGEIDDDPTTAQNMAPPEELVVAPTEPPIAIAPTRTIEMTSAELDAVMPDRRRAAARPAVDYDPLDDGWGPPGTTIPPPLLGAVPGSDEPADVSSIPMPDVDSAPLIVNPPSAPEAKRGATLEASGQTLVRALEDATSRAIELIRKLESAKTRDEVIALLIAHLASSHERAGFFAVKGGELQLFEITPKPATLPYATLRLDRPSTLQDVVGTRLPYRGPMHDDDSRMFLAAALGDSPPEILLVPITIRERVVGVLFGEHRLRHTFDDQLALAARAAGMSLEAILMKKRT